MKATALEKRFVLHDALSITVLHVPSKRKNKRYHMLPERAEHAMHGFPVRYPFHPFLSRIAIHPSNCASSLVASPTHSSRHRKVPLRSRPLQPGRSAFPPSPVSSVQCLSHLPSRTCNHPRGHTDHSCPAARIEGRFCWRGRRLLKNFAQNAWTTPVNMLFL